jgi:hypothetical protein
MDIDVLDEDDETVLKLEQPESEMREQRPVAKSTPWTPLLLPLPLALLHGSPSCRSLLMLTLSCETSCPVPVPIPVPLIRLSQKGQRLADLSRSDFAREDGGG